MAKKRVNAMPTALAALAAAGQVKGQLSHSDSYPGRPSLRQGRFLMPGTSPVSCMQGVTL